MKNEGQVMMKLHPRMKALKLKRAIRCLVLEDGELRFPACGGCNHERLCSRLTKEFIVD